MHHSIRSTGCLVVAFAASSLAPASAWAQDSAPDNQPPEQNAPALNREQRPLALLFELGWNGLAGTGLNLSYHITPNVAVDLGLGLGLAGAKAGIRGRYNFWTGAWSPFVGLGLSRATGSGGEDVEVEGDGATTVVVIDSSPYAQLVTGISYTGRGGLTFLGTAGYAQLLKKNNVRFVSGDEDTGELIETLADGGLVISAALGYAF